MTDDVVKLFRHMVAVWGRCMSEPSGVREIADFLRGRPDEDQKQIAAALMREAVEQTRALAAPDHETSRWGQTMMDPLHIIALADFLEAKPEAEQKTIIELIRKRNADVREVMSYELFQSLLRSAAN
ncbi:hypothetical protein EPO33_02010 [Patescibacteria group bacterium]|nr:MAG: hypothetical protein EPO33_02010 [Patescibacteria group bacterium]